MPDFTKGKWETFQNSEGTYSITAGEKVIAEAFTGDYGVDIKEAEANAWLVAAAPEMFGLICVLLHEDVLTDDVGTGEHKYPALSKAKYLVNRVLGGLGSAKRDEYE